MFEKNDNTAVTTEPIETKGKTKKTKTKKKKEKKGLSAVAFIVPFLLSIALVAGLYVLIGSKTESTITTTQVMYAAVDIDKNTYIAAEDYQKYFKVCDTDISLIPQTAVVSASVLPEKGVYMQHAVVANQMMLITDLSDTDLVMGKYTGEIFKTSIACTTFKSSVSGRIRHGDIINVYAKDPVTKELVLLAKNVYVESAYDANGKACTREDDVAVSFNVWAANEEEVMGLNYAITYGDIQIYVTENE